MVRACVAHRVPIVPYGAGTSVEGHVAALHGGVCVSLAQMNKVRPVPLLCEAGAAVLLLLPCKGAGSCVRERGR